MNNESFKWQFVMACIVSIGIGLYTYFECNSIPGSLAVAILWFIIMGWAYSNED